MQSLKLELPGPKILIIPMIHFNRYPAPTCRGSEALRPYWPLWKSTQPGLDNIIQTGLLSSGQISVDLVQVGKERVLNDTKPPQGTCTRASPTVYQERLLTGGASLDNHLCGELLVDRLHLHPPLLGLRHRD